MKHVRKTILCLSLTLLLAIVIFRGQALSMSHEVSHEEIFNWVAHKLKIDIDYPMPQINVVPKEMLQRVFRKQSALSYKQWVKELGKDEANKTMDMYLKEVIGLFDPKTKIIYVGSFLDPCKFDSIVAHEIVHYLQVMKDGRVNPHSIRFDNVHFLREMQASDIAQKYMKTFCENQESPILTKSLFKEGEQAPQE